MDICENEWQLDQHSLSVCFMPGKYNESDCNHQLHWNLTLQADPDAAGAVVIDCGWKSRWANFSASTPLKVTVKGLDFVNGHAAEGGIIFANQTILTLDSCNFSLHGSSSSRMAE